MTLEELMQINNAVVSASPFWQPSLMMKVNDVAGKVSDTASSLLGDYAYEQTGSPLAGAVGATLPTAAGLLFGGKTQGGNLADDYAKRAMRRQRVQVNAEATGPDILQGANDTALGRLLSDKRYEQALDSARGKGYSLADSPTTKGQGVWVEPADPATGLSKQEFNRGYSQDVGRLGKEPLEEQVGFRGYLDQLGSDLTQWGVGASRFSPLPFNAGKKYSTAVKYPNVTDEQIKQAGKIMNPTEGVVALTPDGGMLVFQKGVDGETVVKRLEKVAKNPIYGKVDSVYQPSSLPQSLNMRGIDSLIRQFGF